MEMANIFLKDGRARLRFVLSAAHAKSIYVLMNGNECMKVNALGARRYPPNWTVAEDHENQAAYFSP